MSKEKKKESNIFIRFVQGRLLSSNFFISHWPMVVLLIVLAMIFISTKYTCQTNAEKIIKLGKELNNAKTECVKASSKFNSQIRESKMTELVDTMKIGITAPDQPPYKL